MRKGIETQAVRFEDDWSDENQDRCPGYKHLDYEISGTPYTCLVKCIYGHPHQERVKVDASGRYRVPLFAWIDDLATEAEALQNIERRQKKAGRRVKQSKDGTEHLKRGSRGFEKVSGKDTEIPF